MAMVDTTGQSTHIKTKNDKLSIETEEEEEEEEEEKKLGVDIKQNTIFSSQSSDESLRERPSSLHAQPTPSSKLSISDHSNNSPSQPKASKVNASYTIQSVIKYQNLTMYHYNI